MHMIHVLYVATHVRPAADRRQSAGARRVIATRLLPRVQTTTYVPNTRRQAHPWHDGDEVEAREGHEVEHRGQYELQLAASEVEDRLDDTQLQGDEDPGEAQPLREEHVRGHDVALGGDALCVDPQTEERDPEREAGRQDA